jgi:hypothetical protein
MSTAVRQRLWDLVASGTRAALAPGTAAPVTAALSSLEPPAEFDRSDRLETVLRQLMAGSVALLFFVFFVVGRMYFFTKYKKKNSQRLDAFIHPFFPR